MSDVIWPICLPCWRTEVSMTEDPPVARDADGRRAWPRERCALCGRPTDHGIYRTAAWVTEWRAPR